MSKFEGLEIPLTLFALPFGIALIIAATALHTESSTSEIFKLKERIEKLEQYIQNR